MNFKVGENDDELLQVDYHLPIRRPTTDLIESVKLRPTYFSFSRSVNDRSPLVPEFRFPQYSCYSMRDETVSQQSSATIITPSPPNVSKHSDSPNKKATMFGTVMNCTNFFFGVGVIALPFAIRLSGWSGIFILLGLGILTNYTAVLLGRCRCLLSVDAYPDIVEEAHGGSGRSMVAALFYLQLLFDVTIFMVLLSQSLHLLLPTLSSTTVSLVSAVLLIVLANCITTAKTLGIISVLSWSCVVALCIVLLAVFIASMVTGYAAGEPTTAMDAKMHASSVRSTMHHYLRVAREQQLEEVGKTQDAQLLNLLILRNLAEGTYRLVGVLKDTPLFTTVHRTLRTVGIVSFCYVGHAVLPSVFGNMHQPDQYARAAIVSFGCMVVAYLCIGTTGYLAFGADTESNVLLNLSHAAAGSTLLTAASVVANVLVVLTVATKYSLAAVPIAESLHDWLELTCRRTYRECRLRAREQYLASQREEEGTGLTVQGNDHHTKYGTDGALDCRRSGFSDSPLADEEARSYHAAYMERRRRRLAEPEKKLASIEAENTGCTPGMALAPLENVCEEDEAGEEGELTAATTEVTQGSRAFSLGSAGTPRLTLLAQTLLNADKSVSTHSSLSPGLDIDEARIPTPFTLLVEQNDEPPATTTHRLPHCGETIATEAESPALGGRGAAELRALFDPSRHFQSLTTETRQEPQNAVSPGRLCSYRRLEFCVGKRSTCGSSASHVAIRSLLPFIALALYSLIPHFGNLLTFTGGVFGGLFCVAVPASCYLRLFSVELSVAEKWAIRGVQLLGVAIVVSTIYVTFYL